MPDGPSLLVDTSTDLRQQALTHRLTRVDAILFTHSHADHVMGLDEVRRFNMMQRGAIPAYADARTAADLRRTFSYIFNPLRTQKGGGIPQIELHAIDGPFALGGLDDRPDAALPRPAADPRLPLRIVRLSDRLQRAFPTRRGRCSTVSTCWCSTRCAIGRIRRTSRVAQALSVVERLAAAAAPTSRTSATTCRTTRPIARCPQASSSPTTA